MRDGRVIAGLTVGWLTACGPVLGGASQTTDAEATGDGDTTGGSFSTGTTAAMTLGPTTEGDDDSGDETGVPDGPTICTDVGPTTPIAVLTTDTGASVLRGDGTQVALDLPPAASPREASTVTTFATRGSWLAAARTTTWVDEGVHYDGEVALFSDAGERAWLRAEPGFSFGALFVGPDATIVASRNDAEWMADAVRYVDADDLLTMPGFYPLGEQRDDGFVPGWVYARKTTEPAWIDTATLDVRPTSHERIGGWYDVDDGRFRYLTAVDGGVAFVRESPGAAAITALPDLGAAPELGYGVGVSSNRRWLLLGDGVAQLHHRVDTETLDTELLDLSPPPELDAFACYEIAPIIDDQGRIVMPLRDASAVRFGRLDPATGAWELVGEPITAVDDASVWAYGDTYMLQTQGQGTTFCPPQAFEPTNDALVGTTVQLVRPAEGTSRTLAADTWPMVRTDGRCVAIADADGVTIVDMDDDTERVLPGIRGVSWWTP